MAYAVTHTSDAPVEENDPLKQIITDAIKYIDEEVSPERAKATDYYFARPFGNESPGRSQVVHSVVRDTVEASIPSVMRIIHGPEHSVEFVPTGPDSVDKAREATEFIRYAFEQENSGFLRTLEVLKDGFVRKMGVFKWYWDDKSGDVSYSLDNIDDAALEALMADESVTITAVSGEGLYEVELTKRFTDGRLKIVAVPPEEFYYNRNARDLDDAIIVGHRTRKTRSQLIEMGIDEKTIDEHGGIAPELNDNEEAIARDPLQTLTEEPAAKEHEGILYCENFVRLDRDEDGVAELRKICTIGHGYHEVSDEATDDVPFALFCPIPEPHTLTGQSLADVTMDLQRVQSALIRGMLDSLSASIFPRTWYKEADANPGDVMNTDIGAPIRTRTGPNAVGVFAHPFVGKEALPVLAFFDEVKEDRVGRGSGADGLHMDSMQSSTKDAVTAAVMDKQMRVELMTRIFAETLKRMFRGCLKLLVQHKPKARMVRMKSLWQNIDPAVWDANMDVQVNVALGSGMTEEKIAMLDAIIAKQEQMMGMLGPENMLTGLVEYRAAIGELISLRGRKDVDRFFKPFGPAELQKMQQQQAQNPPKPEQSPEQILAQAQIQIEQMKVQKEMQIKQAELELKQKQQLLDEQSEIQRAIAEDDRERWRIKLEDDRQRDKQAAEIALKRMEIEAKYAVQEKAAELKAETDKIRATTQAGPSGE